MLAEEPNEGHLCRLAVPSAHGIVCVSLVKRCGAMPLEGWPRRVRDVGRVLDEGCAHMDEGCVHRALFSPRYLEAKVSSLSMVLETSAFRAKVQLSQDVLQRALQPAQSHHLCGVERGFQDAAQALQLLHVTGRRQGAALGGGQQMEEVSEVLQVVGYLRHVSGRQTGEDLLVDRESLVHLGQTQNGVEPRNEVQTSDPLLGGYRLLCGRKGKADTQQMAGESISKALHPVSEPGLPTFFFTFLVWALISCAQLTAEPPSWSPRLLLVPSHPSRHF